MTHATENHDEETTTGFNPMDPAAVMKSLQSLLEKSMNMLSGKDANMLSGMPMDLGAFTKNLEKMIKNIPGMNFGQDGKGMPMDPTAFMKALNERTGGLTDPAQFYKMFEEMMKRTTESFKGGQMDSSMTEMMNPMWWMKKSGETFQRTAEMMACRRHDEE